MFLHEPYALPHGTSSAKAGRFARSGGPRTALGKQRSAFNSLKHGLCPPWVARDLLARGEEPERFSRLHRELISWLGPDDARTRVMVETLAEAWWQKMRRMRNWVGGGEPDTTEIDGLIDDLLQRFVIGMGARHRKWRYRLESAFGPALYAPSILRRRMEGRLPSLGGKAPARKRPSWRALPGGKKAGLDPVRQFNRVLAGLAELMGILRHKPRNDGAGASVAPPGGQRPEREEGAAANRSTVPKRTG
jgi:hypothetical protein